MNRATATGFGNSIASAVARLPGSASSGVIDSVIDHWLGRGPMPKLRLRGLLGTLVAWLRNEP